MGVGAVLGLEKQKLSEGKDLIRYFCIPCAPTIVNGGRKRNHPADAPEKWELFVDYNKRDVEVELAIHQRLERFPVPDAIWDEYHLDQRINDRGVLMTGLCPGAIGMDSLSRHELVSRMKDHRPENPNSASQVRPGWPKWAKKSILLAKGCDLLWMVHREDQKCSSSGCNLQVVGKVSGDGERSLL